MNMVQVCDLSELALVSDCQESSSASQSAGVTRLGNQEVGLAFDEEKIKIDAVVRSCLFGVLQQSLKMRLTSREISWYRS
jgi:hypothetical protein